MANSGYTVHPRTHDDPLGQVGPRKHNRLFTLMERRATVAANLDRIKRLHGKFSEEKVDIRITVDGEGIQAEVQDVLGIFRARTEDLTSELASLDSALSNAERALST